MDRYDSPSNEADNFIRAAGTFDKDALWSDIIGGVFKSFPADKIVSRGGVGGSPSWDVSGWEVSRGNLAEAGVSVSGVRGRGFEGK
jgi:hypothetical protein